MYTRRAVPVEGNTLAGGRGGWWGIVFVVGLFVVGALADLPTAAQTGERIAAFYAAHRQVIVAQQVAGALLLAPFLAFAAALDRRAGARRGERPHRILLAGLLLGVAELATNLPPLVLALLADPSPETAHTLTLIADLADVALFVTIAAFALAAGLAGQSWVRLAGLAVAAVTLVRAFASPLGVTVLDAAAPIAFLVFVLALSVRLLVTDQWKAAPGG
ncbi:MAG TPA: hypothetical protein VFW96_06905 [Thermomicrobiales bacterium]|nr:hypothetical protein [Thermomicrobiales bacterium]